MNIRDLHYFVVLADTKHFGEAAKKCFVSQPTLSMQIKKLEEELDVVLFERTNKQVLLTDHGDKLLIYARKILILIDEMKCLARQSEDPFSGELRLGVIPTVSPYMLPLVMPETRKKFPGLKIWLIEEQTHRLISKLEKGDIDAAIMALPIEGNFSCQILYEEKFYFACASTHSLAYAKSININDLINQPIMLLEEGHCLRDQAIAVCQLAKANEMADFTATSLETLRLMVQAGMGVTLLPALATLASSTDDIRCIPFDEPAPSRSIGLFWRVGTPRQICFNAIAELIMEIIEPKLGSVPEVILSNRMNFNEHP
ncbi:transcriptional regulator [Legionella norrlandica]|uniref:Transcriptional regulator n=1 Tax=Legionella norrlandica TaxID=1498499 RepID=A0A0A2SV15_9GAMM|nr:LysR substrate-binding domain-containing protein [Legionella norrlandica]KGP63576.1 transcriptional regulator [Legionella norrlandica]